LLSLKRIELVSKVSMADLHARHQPPFRCRVLGIIEVYDPRPRFGLRAGWPSFNLFLYNVLVETP